MTDYISEFSQTFVLNPITTALIVIDLQYATGSEEHGLGLLLKKQGRFEEANYRFSRINNYVLPNSKKLIDFFRKINGTIIYITYGAEQKDCSDVPLHIRGIVKETKNIKGNKEHEIIDSISPDDNELVLNKVTMGAFSSTGLESRLRSKGITEIVTVGVSTNNCVGMTAMEASDRGFGVVLVSDATGTCDHEAQSSFEAMFLRLWGRVQNTNDIIKEILKRKPDIL